MVYQCGIIFGFLAIGELIVWLTGIKLPSSIIGMLLLTACLQLKWIRLRWVEGIANFLVKNLGFFFIPPGVALMLHLNVIKAANHCGIGGQHRCGYRGHRLDSPTGKKISTSSIHETSWNTLTTHTSCLRSHLWSTAQRN